MCDLVLTSFILSFYNILPLIRVSLLINFKTVHILFATQLKFKLNILRWLDIVILAKSLRRES